MTERRFTSATCGKPTITKRADGKEIIVGLGIVYYDGTPATEFKMYDDMVERIMPGAADKALAEDDVRGLFNHNPDNVLGRTSAGTMKLRSDTKGVHYEIEPGDSNIARDVTGFIRRGEVTGASFSFNPRATTWKEERRESRTVYVREITDFELFDVGPVTFPAYEATTANIRCVTDLREDAIAALVRCAVCGELGAPGNRVIIELGTGARAHEACWRSRARADTDRAVAECQIS